MLLSNRGIRKLSGGSTVCWVRVEFGAEFAGGGDLAFSLAGEISKEALHSDMCWDLISICRTISVVQVS